MAVVMVAVEVAVVAAVEALGSARQRCCLVQ